jgi:hypothetical protein
MAQVARTGKRVGYSLFLVAIVAFFAGLAADFPASLVTLVIGSLVVGSIVLAPAIVIGYGVKAAAREERENRGQ